MNTEKIEKLKKALKDDRTPENLKKRILSTIAMFEAEDLKESASKVVDVAPKEKEEPTPAPKVEKAKVTRTPRVKKVVAQKESTAKKPTAMTLAKEIRKKDESWNDARARASKMMKEKTKTTIKDVESELDKLIKLVRGEKNKAKVKSISDTNLKRDASRKAKPMGRRKVTHAGETSNQYGTYTNHLGRKYTENRDRHSDRLAPKYPKNSPYLAEGGYLTDPTFGSFQAGVYAGGGAVTNERRYVNKGEDYEVRYSRPILRRTGYKGKRDFELGGVMTTDLAGYTGGGDAGLNAGMPLSGVSGTAYTGLVGETGAMSSGEMFMAGGSLNNSDVDELWRGYASAILFAETDMDTDEPLDSEYTIYDFDEQSESNAKIMLYKYYSKNKEAIDESGLDLETIGMDIWYTQGGHGAGFFDHSLDQEIENILTEGAKEFGNPMIETSDGKVSIRGDKFMAGGQIKDKNYHLTIVQGDQLIHIQMYNKPEQRKDYGDKLQSLLMDISNYGDMDVVLYTTPKNIDTETKFYDWWKNNQKELDKYELGGGLNEFDTKYFPNYAPQAGGFGKIYLSELNNGNQYKFKKDDDNLGYFYKQDNIYFVNGFKNGKHFSETFEKFADAKKFYLDKKSDLYELGGGLPSGAEQSYMITESFGNPAQHFMNGGDLFENYEEQPEELSEIVDFYMNKFDEGDYDYEDSQKFLSEVEAIGYTFDFGLDNEPYNLRLIEIDMPDYTEIEARTYDGGGKVESGDVFRLTKKESGIPIIPNKNHRITSVSDRWIKYELVDDYKEKDSIRLNLFEELLNNGDIYMFPKNNTSFSKELKFAVGGGVRIKNGQTYDYGRVWTNDHNQFDKGADHEVNYRR
jgi:hypothetical protein